MACFVEITEQDQVRDSRMGEKIIAHHINGDFETGLKGFTADQFIPSIEERLLGSSLRVKRIFLGIVCLMI